ncbi:MAG: hypothetical protein LDL33_00160 [Desulfomonile sp.]|nr:hypothetical protein [Desulfomonile sp.]
MREPYTRSDFLEAIFGEYFKEMGNFIFVRGTSDLNLLGAAKFYPNVESLAMAKMPDDQHTLFGVCPRERMKPGRENIQYITALWAGLDLSPEGYSGRSGGFTDMEAAMDAVRLFPLKPSILVQSGRGLHLYWLLKEIVEITDPDKIDALLTTIARYFQCRSETGIHATMRLPGTANPKYPGARCIVTHLDTGTLYMPADFDNLKLPNLTRQRKQPPAAAPSAPGQTTAPPAPEFRTTLRRPAAVERVQEEERPAPAKAASTEGIGISPERELAKSIDDRTIDILADRIVEKITDRVGNSLADRIADMAAEKAFLTIMKWLANSAQDAVGTSRNPGIDPREGDS